MYNVSHCLFTSWHAYWCWCFDVVFFMGIAALFLRQSLLEIVNNNVTCKPCPHLQATCFSSVISKGFFCIPVFSTGLSSASVKWQLRVSIPHTQGARAPPPVTTHSSSARYCVLNCASALNPWSSIIYLRLHDKSRGMASVGPWSGGNTALSIIFNRDFI